MRNLAVGYTRVSTEEQAKGGISLDAQEERLRAYCKLTALSLVEIIREEGVSGTKPLEQRPGGGRLLEILSQGAVKHVVALKLDRLFRDALDALKQTKTWDRKGISLHLVDLGGQALNTSSAMGRFFLSVMAGFAELERNLIAERTSIALSHKRRRGEVYSPTPFGFSREGKIFIENPEEKEILSEILSLYKGGWSFRRIAKELERRGVATKNGRKWHHSTVRYMVKRNFDFQVGRCTLERESHEKGL